MFETTVPLRPPYSTSDSGFRGLWWLSGGCFQIFLFVYDVSPRRDETGSSMVPWEANSGELFHRADVSKENHHFDQSASSEVSTDGGIHAECIHLGIKYSNLPVRTK